MHKSKIVPHKGKVDWNKFSKADPSIYDYSSYVPIKNAVKKLQTWEEKGVRLSYLTSRKKSKEIKQVKRILNKNNFPKGRLFFVGEGEEYKDIVERVKPDVFIDDDCESISGNDIEKLINPKLNVKIIIVKEFEGIDHLSDEPSELLR